MNRVSEEWDWSSLIASITSERDFWSQSVTPSRIGFQRFGVQLREEDFEQQGSTNRGFLIRDRSSVRKGSSGFSVVRNEGDKFHVELDVWPFRRDELMVVVVPGLYVMIDGEHPEKSEDNSVSTRKFTRRYLLPKGCLSNTMIASYSDFKLRMRADVNKNMDELKRQKVDIIREKGKPDEEDVWEALQHSREVSITIEDRGSSDKMVKDTTKTTLEETTTDDDAESDKAVKTATEPCEELESLLLKNFRLDATAI